MAVCISHVKNGAKKNGMGRHCLERTLIATLGLVRMCLLRIS